MHDINTPKLSEENMAPKVALPKEDNVSENLENTTRDIDGKSNFDEPDGAFVKANVPQNVYVGKRNFVHQMMDVALLMANVSQLKALSMSEQNNTFYLILSVIVLSITLQIAFTVCMIAIYSLEKCIETHEKEENRQRDSTTEEIAMKTKRATFLDHVGSILVLGIIVSNVFITGFGVGTYTLPSDSNNANHHAVPRYIFVQNGTTF